jgi:hypothetical protein
MTTPGKIVGSIVYWAPSWKVATTYVLKTINSIAIY